jgi:hypothetical protein
VDDQVIIAEPETLLQKSIQKLGNITSKYGLTISTNKNKTMAFRGRDNIRGKIINNKIPVTEQINSYDYLGCSLSYEKDVEIKLSKCLQIIGIINQGLKPSKVQREANQITNTFFSSNTHPTT